MQVHVCLRSEIAATAETVFDVVADSSRLAQIIRPVGPIPGVVRVEQLPASPHAVEHRNVHMTDGSITEEEITVADRPRAYRYHWVNPPVAPLHWLIRTAESDWSIAPLGTRTQLSWTYKFTLTTPLAYGAVWVFGQIFKRWMAAALVQIERLATKR